ncbi:WD domain, G-beta repeat protein [Opisthorchis viverrini]|uniref:WD domain, G-beta repeat protein n=1 Tax=Opisthorchis viverrini TaxID=6198 RepID=A0A1S8XAB5_OPIVI|nr:WD domain, G-beta repeat protein [Opisthorchis viverrini]
MFNRKSGKRVKAHTDIVRFDRRLIVFDTSGAMEELLPIIKLVHNAHNGIISCLTTARVSNAVFLLLSGGFDRIVKIWDEEGLGHFTHKNNKVLDKYGYKRLKPSITP